MLTAWENITQGKEAGDEEKGPWKELWGTPELTGEGWDMKEWNCMNWVRSERLKPEEGRYSIEEDGVRNSDKGCTHIKEDEDSDQPGVSCPEKVARKPKWNYS